MIDESNDKISESRERLAKISHYFLSEPEKSKKPNKSLYLLPVLLDSEDDHELVYALAHAFHGRHKTTLICHVEHRLSQVDPRSSSFYSELNEPSNLKSLLVEELSEIKDPPQLCLIPITHAQKTKIDKYGQVLMIVPTDIEALRRSYIQIKKWALDNADLVIGVALVDAPNQETARKYFNKLANGVSRFLDRQIGYMGCLFRKHISDDSGGDSNDRIKIDGAAEVIDYLSRYGFVGPDLKPKPKKINQSSS